MRNHFGNYSSFPDNIRARVEGKDEGSITEDLRRRCKYLAHLPLGSDVTFLEIDLEPIVGSKGIEPYAGALKMRRQKRRDRARREDKAKVKSEEREREQNAANWGIRVPSAQTVPTFSQISHPLASRPTADVDNDQPALTPPSPNPLVAEFGQKTVWGTRAVEPTHVEHRSVNEDQDVLNARWAHMEQVALSERLAASAAVKPATESLPGPQPKKKRNKPVSLTSGGPRGR